MSAGFSACLAAPLDAGAGLDAALRAQRAAPRLPMLNPGGLLRAVLIVGFAWMLIIVFALTLMLPVRPDNRLTWWALGLSPIGIVLLGGVLLWVRRWFRRWFGWTELLPVLLRGALLVGAGVALLLLLVTWRVEIAALWPFDNPFRTARW